jgi:hypothetical protein
MDKAADEAKRRLRATLLGRLGLDDASPDRVTNQISSCMEVEFRHDPGAVRFCCFYANVQSNRDLFVGFAFGNQLQNLPFPGAKRIKG